MKQLLKTKSILMTRDYISLFFTIIFCPMLLLIFGFIYGNDPLPIFNNQGTIDIMMPSYSGLVLAGCGFISFPVAVASSRERGELKRLKLTPISPLVYLFSDVLLYFATCVVGMIIIILLGYFMFDVSFTGNWGWLIYGFILSGISIFSIGLVIAAVSKNAKVAQSFGMAVGFPMMFLSGAGMPVEMMPEKMERFSKFLPLTYSVSLMKNIWKKAPLKDFVPDSLMLLVISVIFLLLTSLVIKLRWK